MTQNPPTYVLPAYGNDVHYVRAGSGPPVVLLHGVLGSHRSWAQLVSLLAEDFTLIAPDLLGHGDSSTPRGDYSLGAHAGGLRDLLDELGVQRATLVGHSLGGGVALQFAWLFPERVERLVLVSSGGLGRELSLLLRVPTMPGVGFMLPVVSSPWVLRGGGALGRQLHRLGMRSAPDLEELWRGYSRLGDVGARRAFLATLRTVVDPGGQMINATDMLPVMAEIPTMIVWGDRDRLIPVQHGLEAHRAIPNSRLEIFPKAGHFPHLDEPRRFAGLLVDFVGQTEDRLVQTAVSPARGRRNQSEVSAPAMLRRTAAPQCRVCRRSRGSASSTIGDKAVHSWGCPVLWACRLICAVAPVVAPTRRTGRLVWANAAVTASAVITDAIRWSQRFPPSCRKVSSQSLATGHALLIGWSRMHSNSVMRAISLSLIHISEPTR